MSAKVTKQRPNSRKIVFKNLVAAFPDKDLSSEKHQVPSFDAIRPLPGQENEK
jgi:hypothetical protein